LINKSIESHLDCRNPKSLKKQENFNTLADQPTYYPCPKDGLHKTSLKEEA
jgi:hypothetical protein